MSWQVLDATARHGTDSDPNNSSIVLRLVTQGISVLFAGDLEGDAQRSLLSRGLDLRAQILKVPHHGSAKQDPDFLDAVRAKVALTPVGAGNPYGHPAASTLKRLEDDGARTYRSDRDGDVAVVSRNGRVSSEGRGGDGVPGRRSLPPRITALAPPSPSGSLVARVPASGRSEGGVRLADLLPAEALEVCDPHALQARSRDPPPDDWAEGRALRSR